MHATHHRSTFATQLEIQTQKELAPYSRVVLHIVAKTNWAKGEARIHEFRTKGAPPSPPTNLRVFSSKIARNKFRFRLRFEAPLKPNGNVTNYVVEIHCGDGGGSGGAGQPMVIRQCQYTEERQEVFKTEATTGAIEYTLDALITQNDGDQISFSVRAENKEEGFVGMLWIIIGNHSYASTRELRKLH